SRLVDAAEDVLRWSARARHEGRPPAREPLLERLAGVGDVARGDERARNPRAADRLGGIVDARLQNEVGIELDVERREPLDHLLRLRLCRSRSSRYSRINRSRCVRSSSANSRKICFPSESSNRSPYRLKNWCEPRSQRMPMSSAC